MRVLVTLSLGLAMASLCIPATAGTLADYTAKPGQYRLENGVRVFRVQSTASKRLQDPAYQMQLKQTHKQAENKAFERGYDTGFEAGYDAGYDKAAQSRRTRRNRYNYGRRYSTSGYNPRYSRFKSNISYGRPAYVARGRKTR